jgi:sRNA-binding carbon storage regulator CsrA
MAVFRPGLVISRKAGESFEIRVGSIKVDVVINKIESNKVFVRIIAPKEEVVIMRSELIKDKE